MACLMMGSAIEKGLKSPSVHIITTCVNVSRPVTVSNLTNQSSMPELMLSCSDNTESVKLQIAMAVTFMVGLIQVHGHVILVWNYQFICIINSKKKIPIFIKNINKSGMN